MRTEPAGHSAAEAEIPGREEQTCAQEQGKEATGVHPEQRARGKFFKEKQAISVQINCTTKSL